MNSPQNSNKPAGAAGQHSPEPGVLMIDCCIHGVPCTVCTICAQARELGVGIEAGWGEPPPDSKVERVNHPQHYGGDTVYEVIKVLRAWMTREEMIGFLKGNVIKYTARAGKKDALQTDIEKAQWYSKYLADFTRETV